MGDQYFLLIVSPIFTSVQIWFCTASGLSMTDPSQVKPNTLPPSVHIEEVRIDGQSFELNQTATAAPGRASSRSTTPD